MLPNRCIVLVVFLCGWNQRVLLLANFRQIHPYLKNMISKYRKGFFMKKSGAQFRQISKKNSTNRQNFIY